MAFLKHKDGCPWQASSEHNYSRVSSISLHSNKTGESRQAFSRLVFAFFIAGELAGQTECIAMLAGQAQRVAIIFALFLSGPGLQWGQCRHGLARTAGTLAELMCLGITLSGNHWQNCNLEPEAVKI